MNLQIEKRLVELMIMVQKPGVTERELKIIEAEIDDLHEDLLFLAKVSF